MITIAQIKRYLPNNIEVKEIKNIINGDVKVFLGSFAKPHIIDGKMKLTMFPISFTRFDMYVFGDGENIPEELIKSRVEMAYKQWLKNEYS